MIARWIIVLTLLAHSNSWCAEKSGNFYALAVESCGKWHEASKYNRIQRQTFLYWLSGYITGVNSTSTGMGVKLSMDQVAAYVDHYCENNPLHNLAGAAAALVDEAGGPKAEHNWRK